MINYLNLKILTLKQLNIFFIKNVSFKIFKIYLGVFSFFLNLYRL